ncbi:hypothetical protein DFQ27_003645 [Actinomortierella ambigua]|uniref:Uncharacterized protein n=1 Tax=Actinomortierella ambigua TaxID=1343610 RepID=A0A9P6Q5B9_9FUNG|nr:hypothetical protein DFQ26_000016 [Actinomortierella ambigua]KAG0260246.1 hypothetical protein DFQ27_003645 [Actinomortierella ambigua]
MNPYESYHPTQATHRNPGQGSPYQQDNSYGQYGQQQQQQQPGYAYSSQPYNPNAYSQPHVNNRSHMASPPPLQHPVPTHPPVQMREPTSSPSPRMPFAKASSQQYQQQQPQQQQQQQYRQQYHQPYERSSFDQQQQQNQYQPSPQPPHMSPQQQHQHQHQHQQPQQPNAGIPAFPFNLNDGTTQLGMQFGRSAVMAGQEYVEQNLNRWVNRAALQPYFNVSNSYVVNKLKLLVFPWRHKPWARLMKRSDSTGECIGFLPPRDDINAPDMYIPVMAFVTYILLVGISAGTSNSFRPDILGPTASSALAVILLEFFLIKLCIYLLNITSEVSTLDLLAYSGYKFVGIIASIVVKLMGVPLSVFLAVFLYMGGATGFFLLRSLRYVILPEAATGIVQPPQRKRRIHFLICLSALQFGFMWALIK